MKNKNKFFYLLFVFTISFYGINPVFAALPSTDWGTLPLTDSEDDVIQYTNTTDVSTGVKGDYRDEIDIKFISIQGNQNLTIEFCATPIQGQDYNYTMYFNTDSDNDAEYHLVTHTSHPLGYFSMIRDSDGYHWDASSSTYKDSNTVPYPTSINGNYLTLINFSDSIPGYSSMKIKVFVEYIADIPTLYLDCAPNLASDNGTGEPAISGYNILFLIGIISVVSMILIKKRFK